MPTKTKSKGKGGQEMVYEMVTERILAALEEGIIPWHRPWRVEGGVHKNLKSKRGYRGMNQWLLDYAAQLGQYTSPYWLTYKQAEELGGNVKKDEKTTIVVFNKKMSFKDEKDKDENGDPKIKNYWLLRYYRVFNLEQTEGIDPKKIPVITEHEEFTSIERAEKLIKGMPNAPKLSHGGDRAYYNPGSDSVRLPGRKQFHSAEGYYAVSFHEHIHSTGHRDRLNRWTKELPLMDKGDYSREELIAEMGASMLCVLTGIDTKEGQDNTTAYIQNWIKRLNEDPKFVMQAGQRAQRACDYILDVKYDV